MSRFRNCIAIVWLSFLFLLFSSLIFVCQVYAGANANATISIDLVPNGGRGNQIDDGVTSGTVSGRNTKIVVEVFATGVTTRLSGLVVEFHFNTSLLRFVEAENKAFLFDDPPLYGIGVHFTDIAPVMLLPSGFLARAEFTTVTDVTGQEFSIGIRRVALIERVGSVDVIAPTSTVRFNGTNTENLVKPIPGDLDFDGDVDFADFLIFTENFGKTGPVPTSSSGQPTEPIVTVHDTIYIESGVTPQRERAEKMLGFWQFKGGTLLTEYYVLGQIDPEITLNDGEISVFGSTHLGVLVGGVYSQRLGKYTLLHNSILLNFFYVFDIQGNRAVGQLFAFRSSETLSDARQYNLSSISGRTNGTGFTSYAGKPTLQQLDSDDKSNKVDVPQDIIDAHNRLKAILDSEIQ